MRALPVALASLPTLAAAQPGPSSEEGPSGQAAGSTEHERCIEQRRTLMREAQTKPHTDQRQAILQTLPECDPPGGSVNMDATLAISREPRPVPEASGGRLLGEYMLGTLTGGVMGIATGYIGRKMELARDPQCSEFCGLGGFALGASLGYTLGAPIGVYIVGAAGDHDGSLGAAYLGSLAGELAGIGTFFLWSSVGGSQLAALSVVTLIVGPPLGAAIGFNMTRRHDAVPSVRPVANVSNGHTTFGVAGTF